MFLSDKVWTELRNPIQLQLDLNLFLLDQDPIKCLDPDPDPTTKSHQAREKFNLKTGSCFSWNYLFLWKCCLQNRSKKHESCGWSCKIWIKWFFLGGGEKEKLFKIILFSWLRIRIPIWTSKLDPDTEPRHRLGICEKLKGRILAFLQEFSFQSFWFERKDVLLASFRKEYEHFSRRISAHQALVVDWLIRIVI